MTNIEPPSGAPDLAGQVNSIEEERAQIAAERAALEQERALVRQRREREDLPAEGQPMVIDSNGAPAEGMRPVVDPDGGEFELNPETGKPVLDSSGQPIPKWPHQTIMVDGRPIQVRKPRPEAIQAVAMAGSKFTPVTMQNDMVTLFVKNHISELSFGTLLARMMDPEDSFTIDDFGTLFQEIATLDTGRPTGPSQP